MSEISLFLFGAPRIERDGAPMDMDTRKAVALVAYLAIEDQAFRRDSLAGLLWPEHDSNQARGALRRTLSTLKKAMGGEGIVADRATVGLAPDSVKTDTVAFEALVEQSSATFEAGDCAASLPLLERAVALYKGDFLAGFSLRDSVDFDDWQYYQAESYKRLMSTALERTVECLSMNHRFPEAIERARRWLSLDPLHEPAHRKLMLLFAWSDQRASALKQYRECVALLNRELGVPPLEETTKLYLQITDNEVSPPEPSTLRTSQPIELESVVAPSPVPLVGRADQLDELARIHESSARAGRVALIEGEAGIGKSRLAEEFVATSRHAGAAVATARCHSEETRLAFGAVTELMRSALEARDTSWMHDVPRHWLTECARLLPELLAFDLGVSPPTPLDDPGAQARFFEGIASFLTAACDSSPAGILFVDDLHWADESSMDALLYLAGRLKDRQLLLMATVRSEEPLRSQRARHLLNADRSATNSHLVLERLTLAEVRELVTVVREQDASLSDRLYEETEGLPYFLVEYLAALEEGADPDSPNWSPPSGVRELVASRLERLNEMTLQVLTTAAIIGRRLRFRHRARGRRPLRGRNGDGARRARVCRTRQGDRRDGWWSFSKRRERILFARLRLQPRGHPQDRDRGHQHRTTATLAPACWRLAGPLSPVRRCSSQERSRSTTSCGRCTDGSQLLRSGRGHGALLVRSCRGPGPLPRRPGLDHPEPGRIHEAIADVSVLTGDYSSALTSYETAAALSDQHDLVGIEHKIGSVHHRRGDLNAAQSHLEVALELSDDDDHARRARVLADLSLTAHRSGDTAYGGAARRRGSRARRKRPTRSMRWLRFTTSSEFWPRVATTFPRH